MYLKALEIQGFKSFPDKIRLEMPKGLTAVVGPNGSGKSNVSDSIRWVLGEQSTKSLRGEKMEDVIFSGTKTRRAMGFAEVSIIIDNSARAFAINNDDVKITRKYYRSGESEYKINGQNVRLKDIHELLMDTGLGKDGYSMIGQGKIHEIVNAKGTDRRLIFEEAAGISKYRYRKEQAERKLEQTEENLVRLRDILGELEARVEPLREQSEKADAFLALSHEKQEKEISLWVQKLEGLKDRLRQQDMKIYASKSEYEKTEQALEEIDRSVQEVYQLSEEKLTQIDSLRNEKKAVEELLASAASRIAVLENDILHNTERSAQLSGDAQTSAQSSEETDRLLRDNDEKETHARAQLEAEQAQLEVLQQRLSELGERSSGFSESLDAVTREITRLTATLSNANAEQFGIAQTKVEIEKRMAEIAQNKQSRHTQATQTEKDAAELGGLLAIVNEKIEENANAQAGYREILTGKEKKLALAQEDLNSRKAEAERLLGKARLLEDLEKNMEGFAFSVKYILGQAKSGMLSGIEGPVFQLVRAKQGYSLAIETALGGSMQNIVCRNENDAKQAIYALKKANSGRATFLPLDTVKGSRLEARDIAKCAGFEGLACDLIEYDARHEPAICALLGRVAVAADLDAATEIARKFAYRFKVVTLDGQVVNAGGSMTGGSSNKNAGLLSRASEIESLHAKAKAATEKLEQGRASLRPLEEEIARLRASLLGLEGEHKTMEEDRLKASVEKDRLEKNAGELRALLEGFEKEEASSASRLVHLAEKSEEIVQSVGQAKENITRLEEQEKEFSGSRQNLKEERGALFDAIEQARLRLLTCQKDLEALAHTRALVLERQAGESGRATQIQSEIEALAEKCDQARIQIETIQNEQAAQQRQIAALDGEIAALGREKLEIEGRVAQHRRDEKEQMQVKERLSGEIAQLTERKAAMEQESEALAASFMEEYEISLSEAYEQAQPVEDEGKTQKEVNALKLKIRQLGTVNLAAIEEYKEVSARYLFLKAQVDDVEDSKKQLTELIGELGAAMRETFAAEFDKISRHFSEIFVQLFGGGQGSLTISDPSDVLNSSIDIKVEPPGKIINNLSALSGGEIALVAVSIYFAILKVRPAPFCVLDEVDAALDDVNVVKLAEYLRSLNDKTQFIAITHKRGMMEAADVLYGVTMQEKGVSKLLKMDVTEVESKLGITSGAQGA